MKKIEINHIPCEQEQHNWKGTPFEPIFPSFLNDPPYLSDYPTEGLSCEKTLKALMRGEKPDLSDWIKEREDSAPITEIAIDILMKEVDRRIDANAKMLPYTKLALIGAIDAKLWQKIYDRLLTNEK